MTHVAKSAEREEPPVEGTREYGVEWLREIQRQLAAKADPTQQPDVPCPKCGKALDVRRSRHAKAERYGIYHPRNDCELTGRCWHVLAETREAALEAWKTNNL